MNTIDKNDPLNQTLMGLCGAKWIEMNEAKETKENKTLHKYAETIPPESSTHTRTITWENHKPIHTPKQDVAKAHELKLWNDALTNIKCPVKVDYEYVDRVNGQHISTINIRVYKSPDEALNACIIEQLHDIKDKKTSYMTIHRDNFQKDDEYSNNDTWYHEFFEYDGNSTIIIYEFPQEANLASENEVQRIRALFKCTEPITLTKNT
jgi:hypothetical protein